MSSVRGACEEYAFAMKITAARAPEVAAPEWCMGEVNRFAFHAGQRESRTGVEAFVRGWHNRRWWGR